MQNERDGVKRIGSIQAGALAALRDQDWLKDVQTRTLAARARLSAIATANGLRLLIARDFDGDAFAPTLGPEWHETARESHVAATGLPFAFVTYTRTV